MDFLLIPDRPLPQDAYSLHALVMAGFFGFGRNSPDNPKVLFRCVPEGLRMRASIQPKLGFDRLGTLLCDATPPDLSEVFDVSVLLSPQVRNNGKHVRVADAQEFCARKLEAVGYKVKDLDVSEVSRVQTWQPRLANGIHFPIVECLAQGRVEDESKFRMAYLNGVGREKGFGLGMIVLQ